MEQLGSHWTDFHEIWYLSTFRKFVEKIQSYKNNGQSGSLESNLRAENPA